jgi:hypothetical protein
MTRAVVKEYDVWEKLTLLTDPDSEAPDLKVVFGDGYMKTSGYLENGALVSARPKQCFRGLSRTLSSRDVAKERRQRSRP